MKKFTLFLFACLVGVSGLFAQLTTATGPWQAFTGAGAPAANWNATCAGVAGFGNAVILPAGATDPAPAQLAMYNPIFGATGANYIWSNNIVPPFGAPLITGFFRRCLNIPNLDCSGYTLRVAADDNSVIWVNGVQVGTTVGWNNMTTINITPFLNCGRNVIAVQVTETWSNFSPHWLLADITQNPGFVPVLNLGFNSDCPSQTLTLTAQSAPGATFLWTGPNGFSSTLQNPVISPASAANSGVYTCTVTMPQFTCCSFSTSIKVKVDDDCCEAIDWDTDFTFLTGCLDIEVTDISNNPSNSGGIPNVITWIWGDNKPNTLTSPGATATHTYDNPGTYTVCLVYQVFPNDSTCCHDTICKDITVGTGCGNIPDPFFTATTNTFCTVGGCCIATTLNLNTLLTPTSVVWSWGDGQFSNGNPPNYGGWHPYANSGVYEVTVTVTYHPPCNPTLCCVKVFKRKVYVFCGIIIDDPKEVKKSARFETDNTFTAPTAAAVNIYPNPIGHGNMLTVELPESVEVNTVNVMDMVGKVVLQVPTSGASRVTMELPNSLPSGVYFVTSDNDSFKPQKIVVVD